MIQFSREAQSSSLSFISLNRPFSNFQFIEDKFNGIASLSRIMSQVRAHDGATMVFEEIDPSYAVDLTQEGEDLAKCFGASVISIVHRLSFFKSSFSDNSVFSQLKNDDFIGYAIIKKDTTNNFIQTRVFESVLLPSRQANNFIHGGQQWACRVGDKLFHISGYIYAQQNGATNVCAHVACRTAAARFHVSGDMSYREMNDLPSVAFDHVSKKLLGRGLSAQQVSDILEAAGAQCETWNFETESDFSPPYQKLVYGSIESGYPVILIFATSKDSYHAVPVFGHTFNEDMWAPKADCSYFKVGEETTYIPSDSWLSTFLMHDDNWGSNYCVSPNFFSTSKSALDASQGDLVSELPEHRITGVITTFSREVRLSPLEAQLIGADYLLALIGSPELEKSWGHRLKIAIRNKRVVLRSLLVDSSKYIDHLRSIRDWNDVRLSSDQINSIEEDLIDTSEKVWLIEVSLPELFSGNRRKIGEVLLRTDKEVNPFDFNERFETYLFARIPGYFVFHKNETNTTAEPSYRFLPSKLEGHVPLYGCED